MRPQGSIDEVQPKVTTPSTTQHSHGAAGVRRFVNERELAELFGISRRTLQGHRLRSRGPEFRRLGGAVRYDLAKALAWADQQPGGGEGVA